MPVIIEDTRQQTGKHDRKHEWWAAHGVDVVHHKLDVGDYMVEGGRSSVDTKRSVAEICSNVCGRQHTRFRNECLRAQEQGITLYVLIENVHGYQEIANVCGWVNSHCRACKYKRANLCEPRRSGKCAKHGRKKPPQGPVLAKALKTMEQKYGVHFLFTAPQKAAQAVCDLLGVKYEQ